MGVKLKFCIFSATFSSSPLVRNHNSTIVWKSNERVEENLNEESNTESNNNNNNNNNNSNNNNNNNSNSNKHAGGNGVIVLGVYLHCKGCVETVVTSLIGFPGVEHVEANAIDNRVVVKGKTADPIRVAERVRQKSGKHVQLIYPQLEAQKVVETVLKMNLNCEVCARDIKHYFLKMHGVQTVNVDVEKSLVMVKGDFDPKDLVAYISKRTGRHAEIVNTKNQNNNNNENGNGYNDQGGNTGYCGMSSGFGDVFSDENANGCSIM